MAREDDDENEVRYEQEATYEEAPYVDEEGEQILDDIWDELGTEDLTGASLYVPPTNTDAGQTID